ncbi:MAG: hypothetical protein U5K38_04250 [Woeseiaceae bacterium]|nr:hypothetical protein [Woeseiaceae bacterium]
MAELSRREVLMLLASVGGSSLLPLRAAVADALPAPLAELTDGLDLQAAMRLGRSYLKRYPEDTDIERALQTLLRDAQGEADVRGFSNAKSRKTLRTDAWSNSWTGRYPKPKREYLPAWR